MITGNFHTHTRYSDGRNEPEAFVSKALDLGFSQLGFTDHAPVTFTNKWSMRWDEAEAYVEELNRLKALYSGRLDIAIGLEIDYIPEVSVPFAHFKRVMSLDYTIGGVHLVRHPSSGKLWFIDGRCEKEYARGLEEIFQNDAELAVKCFYRQQVGIIKRERPDVVAHFDKLKMHNKGRYFDDESPRVHSLQRELMRAMKRFGTIVEINTRGIYKGRCDELYPSERLIHECYHAGIPLMLSSDAHHPDELDGHFAETLRILNDIGVKELVSYRNGTFSRSR